MPTPEQFSQFLPPEAPPMTPSRMEYAVNQLATAYGVDLTQPGAALDVDLPDGSYRWMIANIDGTAMGVTRCCIDDEGLCPDLDMIFAITPNGWEPEEILNSHEVWNEYAQAVHAAGHQATDEHGNFDFGAFADYWSQQLEQYGVTLLTNLPRL